MIKRSLRAVIHPTARTVYLPLYDMNRNDRATLEKFLDHVGRHLERF